MSVRSTPIALAVLAMAVLGACSERPLTQLIVVTDTDFLVPDRLDSVQVTVTGPDGIMHDSVQVLTGGGDLPTTLGLVHRGGPLDPIEVLVVGSHGDTEVVRRRAVTGFLAGRTLVVSIHLQAACASVICDEAETCVDGACASPLMPANTLADWDGTPPRLPDAGLVGDGCLALAELCNGIDDDCDGTIDDGFDLATDPLNCGECGLECPDRPRGAGACVASTCGVTCALGFGDCDEDPRNGCEVSLDSLTMCAACDVSCGIEHGTPTCFGAMCAVDVCAPGWGDCNTDVSDGCEAPLSTTTDCGACGVPCAPAHATASCAVGTCRIAACDPGFVDCNGGADGCERALGTTSDCAACDDACPVVANGSAVCEGGRCGIGACATGWGDCNGMALDGCETPLDTTMDCGLCGRACALGHASESCASGSCEITACDTGWDDCDSLDGTGCEANLEAAAHCGACLTACSGTTPLCSPSGTTHTCQSVCAASETLCGTSCVSTATSLDHCGGCGDVCAPPHASAACTGGVCLLAACDPGFGDCNLSAVDGCETPLDTLTHCDGCGIACALAGATESCAGGRCTLDACEPGRDDCDGMSATGCETSILTLSDCGACGAPCMLANASESCAAGACAIAACDPGFSDCNGIAADGCETSLGTLVDCLSCGDVCEIPRASESCGAGACALGTCDTDWANCDTSVLNGCETSLRLPTSCGSCGTACPDYPRATETCATGACAIDRCDMFYGNCNPSMTDGCETALTTPMNCGACGTACVVGANATPNCSTGVCRTMCTRTDRADCNMLVADGCEARITSDESNCGSCGMRCASGETCNTGRCE